MEYYDYINNKGAVYQFKSGRQSALLYDFVDNEAYKIISKWKQCYGISTNFCDKLKSIKSVKDMTLMT